MNCIIREAGIQDASAISQLSREALGYDYSAEDTAKKLQTILSSNCDKVYVAVIENLVVGYIHANDYDLLYAPTMKNIMGIAVDSTYRQCGIGSSLICAVENWAKETGVHYIRLNSGASRKEAHAFYRSCDFDNEKEQLRFIKTI